MANEKTNYVEKGNADDSKGNKAGYACAAAAASGVFCLAASLFAQHHYEDSQGHVLTQTPYSCTSNSTMERCGHTYYYVDENGVYHWYFDESEVHRVNDNWPAACEDALVYGGAALFVGGEIGGLIYCIHEDRERRKRDAKKSDGNGK